MMEGSNWTNDLQPFKLKRLVLILGAAITIIMLIFLKNMPPMLQSVQDAVFDSYQRASPRSYNDTLPVHIVDIDESALDAFGQWPWPRTYMATLTETLFAHGAIVVGYDILFSEPDRTSPDEIYKSWSRFSKTAPLASLTAYDLKSHDEQFADVLKDRPVVLSVAGNSVGENVTPIAGIAVTGELPSQIASYPRALVNLPKLTTAAAGLGTVGFEFSNDGILRKVPMVTKVGDVLVPALSIELLRVAQGAGGHLLRTTEASGQYSGGAVSAVDMRTGSLIYPVDFEGNFRIYFAGKQASRVTSAAKFLHADGVNAELVNRVSGKIILVGSSAAGLLDIRTTPLDRQIAGVEVHAEIIEQIISGEFIHRPDWMLGLEALTIILAGICVTFLVINDRPVWGLFAILLIVLVMIFGSFFVFSKQKMLLNPVLPIFTAVMIYLPGTTVGVFLKEYARKTIRSRFAYFLPTELISEIESDPARALTPKGSNRELTVIFVDMRGFSSITEGMEPERVVSLVNLFLSTVTEALIENGATIDKYMGDAVMGFWNAPIEQPNHAQAGLAAIASIKGKLDRANTELQKKGLPRISIGMGINTGPASVGLMGSSRRLSYTCVGESVTLAARLEGLTRQYGVLNCVGPVTAARCPDDLTAIPLDLIAVKGFVAPVEVFTVVPKHTPGSEDFSNLLQSARDLYLTQKWDHAVALFEKLEKTQVCFCDTKKLASSYLEQIDIFRLNPPGQNWNGMRIAHEKR